MSRPAYLRPAQALSLFLPLTACLLCAAACNNTCFSVALNPPNSAVNVKISSLPPSCTLTTANGAVHLEIGGASAATPSLGSVGPHIVHLFVTLAGVDAHSDALAGDGFPVWQPLLPQLEAQPLQVDLLAGHSSSSSAFWDALLPAGIYSRIRLRAATSTPGTPGAFILEASHCGPDALHCAVLSDGSIQPLEFPSLARNFWILSETIPGGGLYVPPDGVVTFRIEFDRGRSFLWLSGDSLLLAPVFRMSVQAPARPAAFPTATD